MNMIRLARLLLVPTALALAPAGCGESKPQTSPEHVRMAKTCVAGGGAQAMCECQASKVDELVSSNSISPEMQKALILQAEGKEEEADKLIQSLPYDQRFEQANRVAQAQLKCDTSQ